TSEVKQGNVVHTIFHPSNATISKPADRKYPPIAEGDEIMIIAHECPNDRRVTWNYVVAENKSEDYPVEKPLIILGILGDSDFKDPNFGPSMNQHISQFTGKPLKQNTLSHGLGSITFKSNIRNFDSSIVTRGSIDSFNQLS